MGVIVLAACSLQPNSLPEDPLTELTRVPFFPQTIHECGPAALATVLNYSAATTTPDGLALEVYIPERQGSLQIEMLAATRRNGRLPAGEITVNFDAAVARWGNSPTLLFATANNAYASGGLAKAEALYRRVLAVDAGQAAARNNLATLLLDRGCVTAGQREAALALNSADRTSSGFAHVPSLVFKSAFASTEADAVGLRRRPDRLGGRGRKAGQLPRGRLAGPPS